MKLSVMIRGNNFLEADRFGFPMDGRDNVKSLLEKIVQPVRSLNPGARIFLVTYPSAALDEIKAALEPCELVLLDPKGSSQIETFKHGIKHIFEQDDCDAVLSVRFDLEFKKSFYSWDLQLSDDAIHFPWKEYLAAWRDHRRVGDAVHIIGRKALPDFYSGLTLCQVAGRKDLHLLYYMTRTLNGNLRFIEDGYWDSNTVYLNPECDNPLYRIFNRPKLDGYAPYTGRVVTEIRGE